MKLYQILSLLTIWGIQMYQRERTEKIIEILKENGFVTVKFLMDELHYSSATVNRDLNYLQNQNIIKRSFGGAELAEDKKIPLYFRYSKMRTIKNKIGKKAAEFIEDGDTIFIDCSTTAQYIGKYITDRKNLCVITNNLSLASFLSEYGINCFCLGGKISEPPYMVYSAQTVENAKRYSADKFFFSAGGISPNGKICCSDSDNHTLLIQTMLENSKQRFILFDHVKIKRENAARYLATFSDVDVVITDYCFDKTIKKKYKNIMFLEP